MYPLVCTIAVALFGLALATSARGGGEIGPPGGEQPQRRSSPELVAAGLAKVDITPDEPVRLSGYGAREEESQGIGQQIWARALALGGDKKGPTLILTVEVVGIPEELRDRVARRLADRTMIEQGGYEVDRSMALYGKHSPLARAAENRIINAVHRLVPSPYH